MYYQNFAATIQKCFNDIMFNVCKYAKEQTGEENLILSGGCIQNCIGNNVVVESGLFKNVFAGPAPHDAGCAAGLAFYAALQMGEHIENKRLTNSYVGRTYTDDEILSEINDNYRVIDYTPKQVIKYFALNTIKSRFCVLSKKSIASFGVSIIGSPLPLNEVLITQGIPVYL